MIAYRNSTLSEMITGVLVKAKQHRVAENIDYETVRIFVNRAVREVVTRTWSFKRWGYYGSIPVVNGSLLPQEYIKFMRVILHNGDNIYKEARYADVKEFWTVTDINRGNAWNVRSDLSPIFTIWGNVDINPYNAPTAPDTRIWIRPTNYVGVLDCYMYPPELINDNDVVQIPYDFEELVLNLALVRLLYKLNSFSVIAAIEPAIQEEMKRITTAAQTSDYTEKRELDAFVDPIAPYVPKPQVDGEMKQVLK